MVDSTRRAYLSQSKVRHCQVALTKRLLDRQRGGYRNCVKSLSGYKASSEKRELSSLWVDSTRRADLSQSKVRHFRVALTKGPD